MHQLSGALHSPLAPLAGLASDRQPPVRIKEVASCAGVSIATVSRVLNNKGKHSAETRERVLTVVHELGYLPDTRPLARRRTQTVGLHVPRVDNDFMSSALSAVTSACAASGYRVLLNIHSHGSTRLNPYSADGVLVFPGCMSESDLRVFVQEQCPVVLMYHPPPSGLALPRITVDNVANTQAIVGHLIEAHGRRRILHLRGPHASADGGRREGAYRRALIEHDIGVDPALLQPGRDAANAYESTLQLIRDGVPFDAIFAWCDDAAIGALSALRAAGKSVPGDVAIVGFDDSPVAQFLDPPLTTVRAPTDEVARRAVEQLVALIEGRTPVPEISLPTEVVLRRSCGCAG